MGAAVSAPAFAIDWNGDTVTAAASVKVVQQTGIALTVDNEQELSGDIPAGTLLFTLMLHGDSKNSASTTVILGAKNQLSSEGTLQNNAKNPDGTTRNGILTARLEGETTSNYELTNDKTYQLEGANTGAEAYVFKMTGSGEGLYRLKATAAKDILASELAGGIYTYVFVANSYTE
ncbi:Uncharacterised protein [Cedecea neteri]|uniref:Uncharacterized protein n=2 Tax=Cedecea neteri TaxID=158822 RepID=A0A291DZ04_9ENTR|nr:hypothetical protein [Cedecea neteri]ATF93055.1 hypothetical protein CO704_13525 [Cedecea neteri]SQC93060.1 Uncharacterised protein [Cedecea neteri]